MDTLLLYSKIGETEETVTIGMGMGNDGIEVEAPNLKEIQEIVKNMKNNVCLNRLRMEAII